MLPTGAGGYSWRNLSDIAYIVIHHSAVDVDSSAESIAQYHVSVQGWPGISYAWVVHWDGSVEWCLNPSVMSYHVASRNKECLGICIPGNWSLRYPPEPALTAARGIIAWVRGELGRQVPVRGHRELALPGWETSCPGDLWREWLPGLA